MKLPSIALLLLLGIGTGCTKPAEKPITNGKLLYAESRYEVGHGYECIKVYESGVSPMLGECDVPQGTMVTHGCAWLSSSGSPEIPEECPYRRELQSQELK